METELQAWVTERWGANSTVADIQDLGGHSGKTIGFSVSHAGATRALVMRLAPPGVPARGSTDVMRQAPLLRALHKEGVAVPAVVDACADTRFFRVPFLVMERLPGRPLIMGPDADRSWLPAETRQYAHELAVGALAALHRVDPQRRLHDWERARTLGEEIGFWADILRRSPEDEWLVRGDALRSRLLESQPPHHHCGVFHGDFQTNNVLFAHANGELRVSGVVDWEIAGIGATELDLGWFLMMNDSTAWDPVEQRGGVDLAAIVQCYENAAERSVQNLSWFHALACFRMIAIAAINIRMHRSGRRPDEAWERASRSVPSMFARAFELLEN